jgi:hypothetical protein
MPTPTFGRLRNVWGIANGNVYAVGQAGVILALER